VYSGCKAIGLREYRSILLESARFAFPFDYPTDNAEALTKAIAYAKRPPNKRINYQRIGFPYPFTYSS